MTDSIKEQKCDSLIKEIYCKPVKPESQLNPKREKL